MYRSLFSRWLPAGYGYGELRADFVAGATTWILLVPQAMGYALLAGLPPEVGLYAAFLPLVAYAAFGSSRQLAVGPVALDSMMLATAVMAVGVSGSDAIAVAVAVTLMVGTAQLAMGVLRMGFVANFLSRPVLSGFTSAAAIVIASSQLSHLTGLELPRTSVLATVRALFAQLEHIALLPLALGLASFAALVWLKRKLPRLPRGLLVVAIMTAVSFGLGLGAEGLAVVGEVPGGLPKFGLSDTEWLTVPELWSAAGAIALVSFAESLSVGRYLARQGRYEIDANRELMALGSANVSAGLSSGYVVAGGFSRSAVNAQAGAKSQVAALLTASLVGLTLLFFTPLFYHLPKTVLAAIVLAAVLGLVNVGHAKRLWSVKRADFWLLVVSFAATLGLGIQLGLLTGVAASIALFVVKATRPHAAVLGRLPGTTTYRNVERFPNAVECPRVLALRIDAQFYFGNVTFLKTTLLRMRRERPALEAIVLDASGMNQLDSSALDALLEIEDELGRDGIELLLAHVKGPVRDVLETGGWLERLRKEGRVHHRVHDAVERALSDSAAAKQASPREEAEAIATHGNPAPVRPVAEPCIGEFAGGKQPKRAR